MGKPDDAVELLERSPAIYERAFGPDHSEAVESHRNLLVFLLQAARYEEAIPHLREVVLRASDPSLRVDLEDPALDPLRTIPAFQALTQEAAGRSNP